MLNVRASLRMRGCRGCTGWEMMNLWHKKLRECKEDDEALDFVMKIGENTLVKKEKETNKQREKQRKECCFLHEKKKTETLTCFPRYFSC